jgi:hypothetical protein
MNIERPLSYSVLWQELLSELDRLLTAFPNDVPHREVTRWLYDSVYQDLCRHCKATAAQELEAKLQAAGRHILMPESSPLLRPYLTNVDAGCTCCWLSAAE